MLIIFSLTFWYATIQYRKGKLRWIFFVYMFFKTNYIWILLQYVTFHIQVKIGLYIMSPTLKSFNRPFYEILILRRVYSNRVWIERAEFSLKLLKILNLVILSLKTSAVKSDERFRKWRKFLLTKGFVYKKVLRKVC